MKWIFQKIAPLKAQREVNTHLGPLIPFLNSPFSIRINEKFKTEKEETIGYKKVNVGPLRHLGFLFLSNLIQERRRKNGRSGKEARRSYG
jgi:hypothetical protein